MYQQQLFSRRPNSTLMNILIDDDSLIRMSWQMAAKKAGVELRVYSSVADFLDFAAEFSPDETTIYIDSDLDDGLKGEIEAEKIFNLGFKAIHMATGHSADELNIPSYISSVQGKRAPF